MRKFFGTDGIRGKVGEFPITPDFALKLGYAAGKVLAGLSDNPAVIIGKDTRSSGYLFESSLEAGLSYAGVDVFMAGPIPTPAVAYLTRALRLSAGIVISASHNPYYDNGIKFFSNSGNKLPDEIETKIEEELQKEMVIGPRLSKVVRLDDARGRYIEFCKSTFPNELNLNNLKIVLDCANGATYQVAPSIFRELGAQVIKIGCEPDGININNNCGSTYPKILIKKVIEHKADLGIAFDGDGDRVLMVDKNGLEYNGDKLIYIIVKAYLAANKKIEGVVGTVMSNLGLELALKRLNINFIRAKVGDRYVLEELIKHDWILGAEASGHILCLDKHSTGDGIISALQVLASIVKMGKSLKDLIDWEDYPQVLQNIKLNNEPDKLLNEIQSTINLAESNLGNRGRVVVRKSGTEQLIRVMVEAETYELANKWVDEIVTKIKSIN